MRILRSIFAGLIALTVVGTGVWAGESKPLPADLEKQMRDCFATIETPGAVYGVYRGNEMKPELRLTFGYADEKHIRPITFDDHFRIASITKTFTGTVMLQLVDEGKISLDDVVSKYVDGVPMGDKITIRMLGNHISGLPTVIADNRMQAVINAEPSHYWTEKEITDIAFSMTPKFNPGARWLYSNTNTIVLGMVIEKVTGHTWRQEIQTRILDKLGLKQTGFPGEDSKMPDPSPRGYRYGQKESLIRYGDVWYDATNWSSSWAGASGDMYSTLDDLAKFCHAAGTGSLVGEKRKAALFDWVDTRYDRIYCGFQIFKQDGGIGSVGDIPGFSAMAVYMPEFDVTVVCLANLTATKAKLTSASALVELTVKLLNESTAAKPTTKSAVQ